MFDRDVPTPDQWSEDENPPYAYYIYYMFANITVLNHFRLERGLNTFVIRPHCGEAGPVQHLVAGFMMCESIGKSTLLINKRFALNEMFQRNASKFAIFYE